MEATAADLTRLDRGREHQKVSNAPWDSPATQNARTARMKKGWTHLPYKDGHAMDLGGGALAHAYVTHADCGDTPTVGESLVLAQAAVVRAAS